MFKTDMKTDIRPASTSLPADRDILVCVFQRGAADGLNSVVPYGDTEYYNQRTTINIPAPGNLGAAIDLDGFYGLHPALAPLKPIYDAGNLGIVHATGIPHGSRSHFAAQGLMERGVDDPSGPFTGWLGRHLADVAPASSSAFRIVSISGNVPVSLLGASEPLAVSDLGSFNFDQGVIDLGYPDVLSSLFESPAPFTDPAQAALTALQELQAANLSGVIPANGAIYPDTVLGKKLKQAGQLIRSSQPVEVICLDSDGWDHHENLPQYLQQSLGELAGAVSAFYTDMGMQMQRITLLIQTEFGRRVKENGSGGVDHGTGGTAFVIGGGVNGGQVVADWPGLADADLEMGEDLQITIDLRSVLSEMLSKRLGGLNGPVVFPEYGGPVSVGLFA